MSASALARLVPPHAAPRGRCPSGVRGQGSGVRGQRPPLGLGFRTRSFSASDMGVAAPVRTDVTRGRELHSALRPRSDIGRPNPSASKIPCSPPGLWVSLPTWGHGAEELSLSRVAASRRVPSDPCASSGRLPAGGNP